MLRIVAAAVLVAWLAPGAVLADTGESKPDALEFTFIGNAAFKITDGAVTLVSDYPYKSGAFGYMRFDPDDVPLRGNVVCLITHAHRDHLDTVEFRKLGFALIGPAPVTHLFPDYRTYALGDGESLEYDGVRVEAIETPHADIAHNCYIVDWRGIRIFFSGDTEEPDALLAATDLDVALVTPWLLQIVHQQGATIDAERVVVYHHRLREQVPELYDRIVPQQGETFSIEFDASE